MIYSLKGILVEKQKENIIIDVNQISYEVIFPTSSFNQLPEIGKEVLVYTQLIVKENEFLLYGFLTLNEKKLFNILMSVPSLGPKTAYNIVNGISMNKLIEAIINDNDKTLTTISGIGPKLAKRIILELKDKLIKNQELSTSKELLKNLTESQFDTVKLSNPLLEAREALIALGFSISEIEKKLNLVAKKVNINQLKVEEILKYALKEN